MRYEVWDPWRALSRSEALTWPLTLVAELVDEGVNAKRA